MKNNDFCSLKEIAECFGVSTGSIRNYIRRGMLDCILTPGGHRRVPRENFEKFARKHHYEIKPKKREE
jgi:excisionase family DNA binding protein